MFEDLIRELERLDGATVSVPLEADEEGYLDRECPNSRCEFSFKINENDWSGKVRDEEVFCPNCRHVAPADQWFTQDQVEQAKQVAVAQVHHRFDDALKRSAQRFNRTQPRNSFLKVTMQVDSRPRPLLLPVASTEPMTLKIRCSECDCRYAVIGAAFFCPACGHNAAEEVFSRSLAGVRRTIEHIDRIRTAILDRDTAEITCRTLVENGLLSAVTAFQRYMEVLYAQVPGHSPARRNAFQNISEGSKLWKTSTGAGYEDHLPVDELETLNRYFQQRHLLAHCQGIVDDNYIAKSADTDYRPGQRIIVREPDVLKCLDLIERLAWTWPRKTTAPKQPASE